MKRFPAIAALLVLAMASGYAQQQPPPQGQTSQSGRQGRGGTGQGAGGQGVPQGAEPPRDTQTPTPPATSSITGRVVTADTGRPVKRAQVMISGTGRGGRGATTDDQGVYSITSLAAGSYTVSASK